MKMSRFDELMEKMRRKSIEYTELKELKAILEERIRMCEEREECDEAASEYFILRMVENLMKYKNNI
jgi:hypothetical protein